MIFPTLQLRVTPEVIRVELDGGRVLFEEPAALALIFDARIEDLAPIAWGHEAVVVPNRSHEIASQSHRERRLRVVSADKARWYDGDRGPGALSAPACRDPWEYHGECIVVFPFAPACGSIRTWVWLLRQARRRLFAAETSPCLHIVQRWWIRLFARVDIALPEVPADEEARDRLVRALWDIFGSRMRLNGVPMRPHWRGRLSTRDMFVVAAPLALPVCIGGLRAILGLRVLTSVVLTAAASCLALTLFLGLFLSLREPLASSAGASSFEESVLKQQVGPDADPAAYVGEGYVRCWPAGTGGWVGVFVFLFMLVTTAFMLLTGAPRGWSTVAVLLFLLWLVAGFVLSAWLGTRVATLRLCLGQRGIVLERFGWPRRPVLIPYARIRHVATTDPALLTALRVFFHDGQEICLVFPKKAENVAAQIESAIAARIAPSASYRD